MNSLRDIWDHKKRANIPIIKLPEREMEKSGNEKVSKEIRKMSQFGENKLSD